VIVVERGFNRKRYAGDTHLHRSGADRRRIGEGFQDLVAAIQEKRPDVLPVVLEDLSFTEQVSLFLNADTLIGQHGAAFVHAHWMPKGSHLVELQCCRPRLCPAFVPTIARLRGHRLSVVSYPCRGARRDLTMIVDDASKVSRLVEERR
jgi:capsular polysaccharide biosynthesis protein